MTQDGSISYLISNGAVFLPLDLDDDLGFGRRGGPWESFSPAA